VADAADARVTRVERLVVDSELVSDATERLRRLLAGSSASSSWLLSVIMSSAAAASSSSAVRRPRLRVVPPVPVRCLLVDCFALVLVLALGVVTPAVRECDEEGDLGRGSEPIVTVVETLLKVEVSLVVDVVDPMVAIVEVLRSADGFGFGTLLDVEVGVEVEMESTMLAMA
jgi:hypothetical protein